MTDSRSKIRPHGLIAITDKRGYVYFKDNLKEELGIKKEDKTIPYFVDANCVLLARKDATLSDILKGLEILKHDIELRSERE